MNLMLFAACLLGAEGDDPRPLYELRRAVSEVLQREASAPDNKARAAAIYDMTELYQELKRDPRRDTSDSIKEYKTELWSRLTRVKRELQRKFGKRGAAARTTKDNVVRQPSQSLAASQSLASHIDLVGNSLGGPVGLLSQTRNGTPRGAAGGGAVLGDWGPTLVELIERTISPDFWDVNGGPGSIVYYRPLHALVVRASGEVHGDVGGLLGKLR